MDFDSSVVVSNETVLLPTNCNQVQELAKYAQKIIYPNEDDSFGSVNDAVFSRLSLFHTDSVLCGLSALALRTSAPTVLRTEALEDYKRENELSGAFVFGSKVKVAPEKAIVANCSAVREWDSNGTVFGFRTGHPDHQAGEFGHNDFYPVVIAAAHVLHGTEREIDGQCSLRAMLCLDEIRGRLAEVFSLKTFKIDHVLHGSIASAVVYGTMIGASISQIEEAVGMTVSHYIPFRAIRAGHQLSDSKGASAALSTEVAIMSVQRVLRGFRGPQDIFRNPEALFRVFQPTGGESPFNLLLNHSGSNFSIMDMHFKIGLYEHQSAGAIHGLIYLLSTYPEIYRNPDAIKTIRVSSYMTAVGIIGDPAKRTPTTRQSADHSMVYILATLLNRATQEKNQLDTFLEGEEAVEPQQQLEKIWTHLLLLPSDYSKEAIASPVTKNLMDRITFQHGGTMYDQYYPEGIPTKVEVEFQGDQEVKQFDSGMVKFPVGHSRNNSCDLPSLLGIKFKKLAGLVCDDGDLIVEKLQGIQTASSAELMEMYNHEYVLRDPVD